MNRDERIIMDKNQGKCLLAVAVFSLVITFALAVAKGGSCTGAGAGNCDGTGLICSSSTCACGPAFKENASDTTKCISKDTCSAASDCAAVTGATCNTNCVCEGSYKADPADKTKCKANGINDACSADADCSGVSNAECTGSPKTCTCKANYKAVSGLCNAANGFQTILSAPVALLLSFLTSFVTRLH